MSVLNEDKKWMFLHIPKTAGTSMEANNRFGTVITGHYGIRDYIDHGHKPKEYYKFAFVRNPYDRLASAIFAHVLHEHEDPVSVFNRTVIDLRHLWPVQIGTKPQYEYLYCICGSKHFDYIGHYENLENDWKQLIAILGMKPIKLEHTKKGKHRDDYKNLYNKEAKKVVQEIFAKDFGAFGYSL